MSDSGFATASAVEEKMAGIVTSPDSATGGALPDDPRAVAAASAAVDARPDDSLSDGPATDPVVAPDRPAVPRSDPEWETALARARWIARLGRRRRRPDGTREDWLEPAQRAELERRGRVRLAFYKAADAFAAREGRAPDKPEQRRLLAQVLTEEDAPRGWEMVADAFARSDPDVERSRLHRTEAEGLQDVEGMPLPGLQGASTESELSSQKSASNDRPERPAVLDLRLADSPETQQRSIWQKYSGLNPDRLLSADQRRSTMREIGERLEAGRTQGLTVREIADALVEPTEVARYAVTLAGRSGVNRAHWALLEELLVGRTARLFLETEARRMADRVQAAMTKLPPDIWKQLQTSWPNLSLAERYAALRRVTTQVAEELGVRGATLRSPVNYRDSLSDGTVAFILGHIDPKAREPRLVGAPAETNNAFLGPLGTSAHAPVELLVSAVAEEAVHLSQRQALADLEAGRPPASESELTRLMLLGVNNLIYYGASDTTAVGDRDGFLRYLLQPFEFEAKVMQHVFVSQEDDKRYREAFGVKEGDSLSTFLSRGGRYLLSGRDIFE